MSDLQLFADEGTLRPPGIPPDIQPCPGLIVQCPHCQHYTLAYETRTEAVCTREVWVCGYRWVRAGQLHYSEPIPF